MSGSDIYKGRHHFMQVIDGAVDALEADAGGLNAADLYKRVLPFSGMGPFTAANVLQLLGVLPKAVEACSLSDRLSLLIFAMVTSLMQDPSSVRTAFREILLASEYIRVIRQSMVSLPGPPTISKG